MSASAAAQSHLDYWRSRLSDLPAHKLPLARPRALFEAPSLEGLAV